MAIDFPDNPTDGQLFTAGEGAWVYDSSVPGWVSAPTVFGSMPAGTIIAWAPQTPPDGWLVCDGSAVSRTTYATLFNAIGTTYGAGNGTTTFNLPNLKGRVPVGRDASDAQFDSLGETGGSKTHTLSINEIPSHNHSGGFTQTWAIGAGQSGNGRGNDIFTNPNPMTGSTGGGQPHNNLQPYQVVNYIIKWTMATSNDNEGALTERLNALESTANAILPTGSIVATALSSPPAGWLLCDGSAVSRTEFASLFGVIGTTYGSGDGTTTFNLPDLRGRVPVGRDSTQIEFDTLGEAGGSKTHTLTVSEMPSHSHRTRRGFGYTGGSNWTATDNENLGASFNQSTEATGGGQPHNNLQPYRVVNYIIKHSTSEAPSDSELASRIGTVEARPLPGLIPAIATAIGSTGGTVTTTSLGVITFNNVSAIALDGIFSSLHGKYRVILTDLYFSTASDLQLRLRSGGTNATSLYYYGLVAAATNTITGESGANVGQFLVGVGTTGTWNSASFELYNPAVVSKTGFQTIFSGWTGQMRMKSGAGFHDANAAFDGFALVPNNGATMNGSLQVFAYND